MKTTCSSFRCHLVVSNFGIAHFFHDTLICTNLQELFLQNRGTQHVIGTVSNEATNDMGYRSWPLWSTCFEALVKTVDQAVPLRCFHCAGPHVFQTTVSEIFVLHDCRGFSNGSIFKKFRSSRQGM